MYSKIILHKHIPIHSITSKYLMRIIFAVNSFSYATYYQGHH